MAQPLTGSKRYQQLDAYIGQGTYGKVEKAKDLRDNEIVAIKKVKVEGFGAGESANDEDLLTDSRKQLSSVGIHFTVLREIKIMKELHHPNIISERSESIAEKQLLGSGLIARWTGQYSHDFWRSSNGRDEIKDVYVEGDFINLVMPHMTSDLRKLLERRVRMNEAQIKCIVLQITQGISELHSHWFMHRDLAPANVFIDAKGLCKVADFGLSRTFGSPRPTEKTPKVVTLWYRAPELLYGATQYQDRVDVWSIGCIFAELLQGGRPLFPGQDEIEELGRIFELLGTPNAENWPDATNLPNYFEFTQTPPKSFNAIFPNIPEETLDLLKKMLSLDPSQRISAAKALEHPYFSSQPLACNPDELPLRAL